MEEILLFSVLVVFGVIPPATLMLWFLFKRTIAFPSSVLLNWHGVLVAILAYTIAKIGLIHIVWAAPLAVGNVVFGLFLNNVLVSKPIKALTKGIDELAKGNFDVELDSASLKKQNEIGSIARSLSRMLENLQRSAKIANLVAEGKIYEAKELSSSNSDKGNLDKAIDDMILKLKTTIETINASSIQIGVGASEINLSSQSVASGANEQAVSIEELSASMEEMLVSIKQTSDNARETSTLANKSATDIRSVSQSVAKAVESVNQIAEKVKIMQDIAKKTDMLAINASIEASRAGNLGKGFASVALEVRRLAESANSAANYITDLAHTTLQGANQSNEMLKEVIPSILKTSSVISEIAQSSSEQHNAADQVNSALAQLNEITQQNAASSEELAGTSEEFASQAEQLQQVISFFKLSETKKGVSKAQLLEKVAIMNRYIEDNFSDIDEENEIETLGVNLQSQPQTKLVNKPEGKIGDILDQDFE